MKKIFFIIFILILAFILLNFVNKTQLVSNQDDGTIYNYANDNDCNSAANRIAAAFQNINSIAVLKKNTSLLCGIELNGQNNIPEDEIKEILYDIFPDTKELRLEINSKTADDILELSYLGNSDIKKKYLSLRFDFLMSKD